MSKVETRPIFEYECVSCKNNRRTLIYSRAVEGQCMKCKRMHKANPNQSSLFERQDDSKRTD